jgi:hypothetical protein
MYETDCIFPFLAPREYRLRMSAYIHAYIKRTYSYIHTNPHTQRTRAQTQEELNAEIWRRAGIATIHDEQATSENSDGPSSEEAAARKERLTSVLLATKNALKLMSARCLNADGVSVRADRDANGRGESGSSSKDSVVATDEGVSVQAPSLSLSLSLSQKPHSEIGGKMRRGSQFGSAGEDVGEWGNASEDGCCENDDFSRLESCAAGMFIAVILCYDASLNIHILVILIKSVIFFYERIIPVFGTNFHCFIGLLPSVFYVHSKHIKYIVHVSMRIKKHIIDIYSSQKIFLKDSVCLK